LDARSALNLADFRDLNGTDTTFFISIGLIDQPDCAVFAVSNATGYRWIGGALSGTNAPVEPIIRSVEKKTPDSWPRSSRCDSPTGFKKAKKLPSDVSTNRLNTTASMPGGGISEKRY
jgi:hypothetical protein